MEDAIEKMWRSGATYLYTAAADLINLLEVEILVD